MKLTTPFSRNGLLKEEVGIRKIIFEFIKILLNLLKSKIMQIILN